MTTLKAGKVHQGTIREPLVVFDGSDGPIQVKNLRVVHDDPVHVYGINGAILVQPGGNGHGLRVIADEMHIHDLAFRDYGGMSFALGLGPHQNDDNPPVCNKALVERVEFEGCSKPLHRFNVKDVTVDGVFGQLFSVALDNNPKGGATHGYGLGFDMGCVGGGNMTLENVTVLDAIGVVKVAKWGYVDGGHDVQTYKGATIGSLIYRNWYCENMKVVVEIGAVGVSRGMDFGSLRLENVVSVNPAGGWKPAGGWPHPPATNFRGIWFHDEHLKNGEIIANGVHLYNVAGDGLNDGARDILKKIGDGYNVYNGAPRFAHQRVYYEPRILTPVRALPGGQEPPTTPPQPPTTTPNPPGAATGTITVRLLATMDGQPLAMPDALASITVPATGAISESEQALLDIYRQLAATQRALVQNVASALLT